MTNNRASLVPSRLALFVFASAWLAASACGGGSERPGPPPGPDGSGGRSNLGGDGGESSSGDGDEGGDGDTGSTSGGDGDTGSGGSSADCDDIDCGSGDCSDEDGTASCQCRSGYAGTPCEDVDECAEGDPCSGQRCVNIPGSFFCSCDDGFVLDGQDCVPFDECSAEPCDTSADCNESADGYGCTCKDGYFGNGWTCTDQNHCAGDPCGEGECVVGANGPLCLCQPGTTGQGDCTTTCSTLDIADPVLAAAIEAELGTYLFAIDPAVDLVGRNYLSLSGQPISSLDGLECWPNLRTLVLNGTQLGAGDDDTPIEALASLKQLVQLDLACTSLTELSELSDHPSLQSLYLSAIGCSTAPPSFSSLEPISTISQLVELDVSGHGLSSLSFLAGVKSLRALVATENLLTDTSDLTQLGLLQTLDLSENNLSSLDGLVNLKGLKELRVRGNPITSLAPINQLPALQKAVLSQLEIDALPSLDGASALQDISLARNDLTSISGLETAPNLQVVDLSDNELSSLAPFVQSGFSGILDVSANDFDCDESEAQFNQLREQGASLTSDCD